MKVLSPTRLQFTEAVGRDEEVCVSGRPGSGVQIVLLPFGGPRPPFGEREDGSLRWRLLKGEAGGERVGKSGAHPRSVGQAAGAAIHSDEGDVGHREGRAVEVTGVGPGNQEIEERHEGRAGADANVEHTQPAAEGIVANKVEQTELDLRDIRRQVVDQVSVEKGGISVVVGSEVLAGFYKAGPRQDQIGDPIPVAIQDPLGRVVSAARVRHLGEEELELGALDVGREARAAARSDQCFQGRQELRGVRRDHDSVAF